MSDHKDITLADIEAAQAEIHRLEADLAAHKAALADVVERAVTICKDAHDGDIALMERCAPGTADRLAHSISAASAIVIGSDIRRLAPPDVSPYAKVLEAARRYDDARIARPLLYAKKRAEAHSLENAVLFYLHEADEPLAQAQADLHEALAGIGRG